MVTGFSENGVLFECRNTHRDRAHIGEGFISQGMERPHVFSHHSQGIVGNDSKIV
jgi:hypothetical protein